jgi:hypothetical protein
MQTYRKAPSSSNTLRALREADVLLTQLFEQLQRELRTARDSDDELLVAGTGLLRARMQVREAVYELRRLIAA